MTEHANRRISNNGTNDPVPTAYEGDNQLKKKGRDQTKITAS